MSVSALQRHILWCRKNAISWTSLMFGDIHIEGSDMLAADGLPKPKPEDRQVPVSIQQRYGAALLEEATKSEGMTSVVEEDV